MILIGQYDSPFVRRVGLTLALYELSFEHRPWSVFSDGDKVRALNPLMRVPTFVLDDGEVLLDSRSIIDHLESHAAPERSLTPEDPKSLRAMTRVVALAHGAAELAASLFYELRMHHEPSGDFVSRRRSQIRSAIAALEADRADRNGNYWLGDRLTHADVAFATAYRFIVEIHPGLFSPAQHPAIVAQSDHLEEMPVFKAISQPFVPPP
ncbi:MAG: glutathione S-transferase family protein [Beijerinckiaceae bacterium]